MDMSVPSEELIAREMEANPGLGRMQAINTIRNRRHVNQEERRTGGRARLSLRFAS